MDSLTFSAVSMAARQEKETRQAIRANFLAWANFALTPQNCSPAPHHRRIIAELAGEALSTTGVITAASASEAAPSPASRPAAA